MSDSDKIGWKGKQIYVRLKNSNRAYSGVVLSENDFSITIKDIVGHLVTINFSLLSFFHNSKHF